MPDAMTAELLTHRGSTWPSFLLIAGIVTKVAIAPFGASPGNYQFGCVIPGQVEAGMVGN